MKSYTRIKKKLFVFYKFICFLEVEIEDEYYSINNKLNYFFGQKGIYENTEKLLNIIKSYFKFFIVFEYIHKMKSYTRIKKKLFVFYKFICFLEVEIEDEYYSINNKLNYFFGQKGIYENTEKLLNIINNYKNLNCSFLIFKKLR